MAAAIVFVDIAVQDGFLVFVAFLMIEKNVPASLAAFAVVATLAGGVLENMLSASVCGLGVFVHCFWSRDLLL
ncbi:MAG: hypothetical protein CM1200mP18_11440 [Gammaproteobacteria bacterium]|nr:MAG: hypothetical protein CM1200mP18_11440 [Gammaproteobacteria bacterium]